MVELSTSDYLTHCSQIRHQYEPVLKHCEFLEGKWHTPDIFTRRNTQKIFLTDHTRICLYSWMSGKFVVTFLSQYYLPNDVVKFKFLRLSVMNRPSQNRLLIDIKYKSFPCVCITQRWAYCGQVYYNSSLHVNLKLISNSDVIKLICNFLLSKQELLTYVVAVMWLRNSKWSEKKVSYGRWRWQGCIYFKLLPSSPLLSEWFLSYYIKLLLQQSCTNGHQVDKLLTSFRQSVLTNKYRTLCTALTNNSCTWNNSS